MLSCVLHFHSFQTVIKLGLDEKFFKVVGKFWIYLILCNYDWKRFLCIDGKITNFKLALI